MSEFTDQQEAAIQGKGNLLVVAGAGTGKTRTLVGRCLRLVVEEGVSLENILMVTFTEEAAAEMRSRLREKLRELQTARLDEDHLAQQVALLDMARISTLHSFCLHLAREHFHELSVDPQFSVLDEQQTRPLQREALDELFERHYTGTDAESHAVQELVRTVGRGSDYSIRQLVLKLHAYTQSLPNPDAWLKEQEKGLAQPEPTEWRASFREAVNAWRSNWLDEIESFADAAPAVQLCLDALEQLPANPDLEEIASALWAVVEANADDGNWPHGTKGTVRNPLKEFFEEAEFLESLLPDDQGNDSLAQDWEWARHHLMALIGLTREFTHDFTVRKREVPGVDFADLEQCALRLLREPETGAPTATACAWRERLEHIFVDEYQDINAAQDAILTALGREGSGNRFMVGDVKQSIYRFRLANPKIFQRYSKVWSAKGRKGKTILLTENFRSRDALLDFINPLFDALMREEIGGVNYEPLKFGAPAQPTAQSAKAGHLPRVEFHLIARAEEESEVEEKGDEVGATPDLLAVEREARLVARRLRELKEQRQLIWDDKQQAFRPVEWRDMAVLLRSPSGRSEAFAMEFSKACVPLITARDGFFASLEVSDLLNLLKLLDNPLQDIPLLAVLRSPLVGMSLDELAEVRLAAKTELFWTALKRYQKVQSSEKGAVLLAKVETFLNQFARWRELVRQTSLSQCLETALTETHYEDLLLAGERGVERVANVRRLLDLGRQFDPYQRQGLHRFLRFVREQEDEDLDLQPASPPTEDAVKLLSIHRSKGLEFPVVVLAGLGTRFNEQDLHGQVLLHETLGLCPRITPPGAAQSYPSLTHRLARRVERRELRGEELRLFYVALTRARDALILVGTTHQKADAAKWEPKSPAPISTKDVADARSHLDWLQLWLPRATKGENWDDDRSGKNKLLNWRIYDEKDAGFADDAPAKPEMADAEVGLPGDEAVAINELKSRLAKRYQFESATTRAAKTSVSELRRRAADELADEARPMFWSRARRSRPLLAHGQREVATKLSAAERGTAHHVFLQFVELARAGNENELRAEAERLQQIAALTTEQASALDFGALSAFWQSEVGQKIRAQTGCVRREFGFTARFAASELDEISHHPAASPLNREFVVVQGVADLVVRLSEETWLLDFKTDEVKSDEVAEKVKSYEPQLKLYALALERICRKPVTNCWLHFLSCGRTERLAL